MLHGYQNLITNTHNDRRIACAKAAARITMAIVGKSHSLNEHDQTVLQRLLENIYIYSAKSINLAGRSLIIAKTAQIIIKGLEPYSSCFSSIWHGAGYYIADPLVLRENILQSINCEVRSQQYLRPRSHTV